MFCLDIILKENETIDDLQYKGLRIIQKKEGFRFGLDAVLLANFADVKKSDTVIDSSTVPNNTHTIAEKPRQSL